MNVLFSLLLLLMMSPLAACPTCTGRITQSSPPFFSDEFYKPTTENMDELYQAVLPLQQDMIVTTTTPPQPQDNK